MVGLDRSAFLFLSFLGDWWRESILMIREKNGGLRFQTRKN